MVFLVVIVALALFDIGFHLVARKNNKKMAGDVSKAFLMPLIYLSLFTASAVFNYPIAYVWIIYLVMVFYTIGDILMIFKNKGLIFFNLSALSFTFGHFFLAYYFLQFGFTWVLLLFSFLFFGSFYYVFLKKIKSANPPNFYSFALYGFIVLSLALSLSASFSQYNYLSWSLRVFGVISFAISDSKIAYKRVGIESTSEFFIMLTYILANLFFAFSIWFLNAPIEMY